MIIMPMQGNCLNWFVHNDYKPVILNKNKITRTRIYKRKTVIMLDCSTLCFKKNILKVCIRFLTQFCCLTPTMKNMNQHTQLKTGRVGSMTHTRARQVPCKYNFKKTSEHLWSHHFSNAGKVSHQGMCNIFWRGKAITVSNNIFEFHPFLWN